MARPYLVALLGLGLSACIFDSSTMSTSDDAGETFVDARVDALWADASAIDAAAIDASAIDASVIDASAIDGSVIDAAPPDAAPPDAAPPDAAPPDAAPPDAAPPDAGSPLLETLIIDSDGSVVVSANVLTSGVTYRLRCSGTLVVRDSPLLVGDAEYFDFSDPPDSLRDTANGVDVGVAIDDVSPVDDTKTPNWGTYQSSHVYEVDWMGADSTIQARFFDPNYSNNSGSLTLEIFGP